MTFFYEIGSSSPESHDVSVISHIDAWTHEHIDRLVKSVLPDAVRLIFNKSPMEDRESLTYPDVHDAIIDLLIERFGFKRVEFTVVYNRHAWPNLLKRGSWNHYNDDLHDVLVASGTIPAKAEES